MMFPPAETPTASFPYRIEAKVGVGSMGIVYRAIELALDRPVAIKALRQSILEDEPLQVQNELRRRFHQEARAAAALSHPAVTTIHGVGEEGGTPYIVMEWLEGRTLDSVLKERGTLPPVEAVRTILELLDALEVAHRNGVVHRDIKPANLLILRENGRLKVTDFGIALLRGRELVQTKAGVVLATPKFASPEQLRGIDVDGRADLFSAGILLYTMLTGAYPFRGTSFMELANAILTQQPPTLRDLDPSLPAALDVVTQRALTKDRDERYPIASKMAEPLRAFLAEQTAPTTALVVQPGPTREDETAVWRMPSRRGLPLEPSLALARTIEGWPVQELARQPTQALIDRLLDKPLHAAAFSGAVIVDNACLLLMDGMLLGAVDTVTGAHGDAVVESLPDDAAARLHPVPSTLPAAVVGLLGTILHPPRVRMADLDSSFVNLPALAEKLRTEAFDGLLRLRQGQAWGLVFFDRGETALSLFSEGWDDVPLEESWQRWVTHFPVKASVEDAVRHPLALWYRRTSRDLAFAVEPVEGDRADDEVARTTSSRVRQLLQSPRTGASAAAISMRLERPQGAEAEGRYEHDPVFRFTQWALRELPQIFVERKKTATWKYLAEWLLQVRGVTLHHDLPRPGGRDTDTFDLVTQDATGKVLHVGQRFAQLDARGFEHFVEQVIAAKTARKKTGDIGGVFLITPRFGDDVLEAYRSAIVEKASGRWFGVEESFTGYEGFVRIGARRGFHLLLVEERDDTFEPILPS